MQPKTPPRGNCRLTFSSGVSLPQKHRLNLTFPFVGGNHTRPTRYPDFL